jgi:hypothetical protein
MPRFASNVFSLTVRLPVGGFIFAKNRLDRHMPASH